MNFKGCILKPISIYFYLQSSPNLQRGTELVLVEDVEVLLLLLLVVLLLVVLVLVTVVEETVVLLVLVLLEVVEVLELLVVLVEVAVVLVVLVLDTWNFELNRAGDVLFDPFGKQDG